MPYTLVITSCGRHHLLRRTFESFMLHAEQRPREIVIIEDGPTPRPDWLPAHGVKWISNGIQRGQIFSIDKAYDEIKTDYIFHCEDDWQFCEGGFITHSLDILERDAKVHSVMVRNDSHPVRYADGWGHFSYNPGLRRRSDYALIGSYGRHVGYGPDDLGAELRLSKLHKALGYRLEWLPRHCYHIGDESHVPRSSANPLPRILIAVPTALNLDYAEFRKMQQAKWGRTWENGVSGLQIDGLNKRLAAIQDTWGLSFEAFKNVTVAYCDGSFLGCGDSHVEMPHKMRRICEWMVGHDFDLMFRPDDDTWVDAARLVRQGIELEADYAGFIQGGFVIGGPGIWQTRKACEIVAAATPPDYQTEWRDDAWMGQVLLSAGIRPVQLPGLYPKEDMNIGPEITLHPVGPDEMRQKYAASHNLLS